MSTQARHTVAIVLAVRGACKTTCVIVTEKTERARMREREKWATESGGGQPDGQGLPQWLSFLWPLSQPALAVAVQLDCAGWLSTTMSPVGRELFRNAAMTLLLQADSNVSCTAVLAAGLIFGHLSLGAAKAHPRHHRHKLAQTKRLYTGASRTTSNGLHSRSGQDRRKSLNSKSYLFTCVYR